MKKRTIQILFISSIIFFLLALCFFSDASLIFTGIGIILLAIVTRELIINYWDGHQKK